MGGPLLFHKGEQKRKYEKRKKEAERREQLRHWRNIDGKLVHEKWIWNDVSISKKELEHLYIVEKKSQKEIAEHFKCSHSKICYWIIKYKIPVRTKSEAMYVKCNPSGDPFSFKKLETQKDYFLFGLGLGLYWGEGVKVYKNSIRLGNTDPRLIRAFLKFLKDIYNIDESKVKFGLQIFGDIDKAQTINFWMKELSAKKSQFQEIVCTPSRGEGIHKKKSEFGVLTVYFHNMKLRDIIMKEIEKIDKN